ncbi:short-chain dehydrogenase/reductase [Ramlibacter sp.]|uniref:short-chain dehydrogenase/reductase n=1 Tax=Ramlibacter sp. TaxID=1917967 RepID=UPI003D11ECFB
MIDLQLQGLRAVVTGATGGIGNAIAEKLALEGCALTLVARDPPALDREAARLGALASGAPVATIAADLGRPEDIARVAVSLENADILVNAAGAVPRGQLLDTTAEAFRWGMAVKGFGTIDLCREAFRHMKARRRGVILNIIGNSGQRPNPKSVGTSTVNAALIAFTEAVGSISPDDNVRVLGINPGLVATPRTAGLLQASADPNDLAYTHLTRDLPFGRMARPEEIADFAAFLVSARAGYCSGSVYTIDGGARLRV